MPLIHVDMSEGKATEEQKARLISKLTDVLSEVLGEEQRAITIVTLIETPLGNRGVGGKVYEPQI
jgi:4-oxalocrotonate tautomerase family enzyme